MRAAFANCAPHALEAELARLSAAELTALWHDFALHARADQLPPGFDGSPVPAWSTWLFLGGRGAGKTRAGAEWLRGLALGRPPYATRPVGRLALIGETLTDVRAVMVEGVSGLLAVHPRDERPTFTPSRRRLVWPNGAMAECFSADTPDALRGPQFAAAWGDEVAKWARAEEVLANIRLGLRLGPRPRLMLTTTPRPLPMLKALMADPATVVTRASTAANAANLPKAFLAEVSRLYAGTRLGRQELDGEIIDAHEGGFFSYAAIDAARVAEAPQLSRVVVAVDPPAGERGDRCGLVAAGRAADGRLYVLADATLGPGPPLRWARAAVEQWRLWEADAVVVEVNQGGAMVRTLLHEIDPAVPVIEVRATRGKALRAEPVAALYEQGRVAHAGRFPALEDELCAFGTDGLPGGASPDRVDALVWALTHLAFAGRGRPRVRVV